MKRLGLLVMPLMAVSLLASCGGGSKITDLPNDLDLYRKMYVHNPETGDVVTFYEYEYNEKNLLIKTTTFTSYLPNENTYDEMTYDENNNVITEDIYTIKSGIETSRAKSMYENQYDAKKRLIQVIDKHYDEDDGWVIRNKKTLEYKTNSEIEECYVYNTLTGEYSLSNKSIYTYDNNGCLVNQKDYDIQENYAEETVITVDKYGCAVLAELYYLSMDDVRGDKIVDTKTTYLDNLWYRPLKSEQISVDSSEDNFTYEYEYNDKRQIVSEKRFRNEECVYHYTYEY